MSDSIDYKKYYNNRFAKKVDIKDVMRGITKPIKKKFYGDFEILTRLHDCWPQIVGINFAMGSNPHEVKSFKIREKNITKDVKTLYIKSYSPDVTLTLQHRVGAIIEAITTTFGYKVFDNISIVQDYFKNPSNNVNENIYFIPETKQLDESVMEKINLIQDPNIRKSLLELAKLL